LNAEKGKIGYINEVMGVYRLHPGGMYSPFSEARKQAETLKFYKAMNRNFNFSYDSIIRVAISKYFIEWAEEYLHRGELPRARTCYRTCLAARPINRYIPLPRLVLLGVRLLLPSLPVRRWAKPDSRKI
jgi:hypothetical protein